MKMNKLEKKWVLYDVGNSAFILLATTVLPLFFNSLAKDGGISPADYLAYWGYSSSIVTLLVALIGLFSEQSPTVKIKRKKFLSHFC